MENIHEYEISKPSGDFALLPCPFCGSHEVYYEKYTTQVGYRFRVICAECTASIDPGYAQQKNIVQKMWNNRSIREE